MSYASLKLNKYEEEIASGVIFPSDINVSFKDIGGLDSTISLLTETVLYPLMYPQLFTSEKFRGLLTAPKGVLLHGPPGTGKTMIAKALATESNATFINISLSMLVDKWYGESQKMVSAIFTLAKKLEPCIVFIDELDSFLRERSEKDHEVTAMVKAIFLSQWDGLATAESSRALILGATNRMESIDPAILRRMPTRIEVALPNDEQREHILRLILKTVPLSPEVSFESLVAQTKDMSGSDLKEFCRKAAMKPVREAIRKMVDAGSEWSKTPGDDLLETNGPSADAPEPDIAPKQTPADLDVTDLLTHLRVYTSSETEILAVAQTSDTNMADFNPATSPPIRISVILESL
ncbi:hypothetical protein HDU98_008106, partial [Podochytrium sp. JEL0797]